jgi:hypothetical protein
MRGLNRRLQKLAAKRQRLGIYGRRNVGWRSIGAAPGTGLASLGTVRSGLKLWLRAEWETFWAGLSPKRRRGAEKNSDDMPAPGVADPA